MLNKILLFIFITSFCLLQARYTCLLPNRLYISSEFYYRKFKQQYIEKSTSKDEGFLKGFQIGYDFIRPNSFYFGGDVYQNTDKSLEKSSYFQTDLKNEISNYELRLGMTFPLARSLFLSMFATGGYHYLTRKADENPAITYKELKFNWNYLGGGIYLTLLICPYWKIAFHGKMSQMMEGKAKIFPKNSTVFSMEIVTNKGSIGKKWQYVLELPNYFYYPKLFPFDIALVPFIKNIDMKEGQLMALLNNGQRIYTPSNKQFEYGLRIEIGLNF